MEAFMQFGRTRGGGGCGPVDSEFCASSRSAGGGKRRHRFVRAFPKKRFCHSSLPCSNPELPPLVLIVPDAVTEGSRRSKGEAPEASRWVSMAGLGAVCALAALRFGRFRGFPSMLMS